MKAVYGKKYGVVYTAEPVNHRCKDKYYRLCRKRLAVVLFTNLLCLVENGCSKERFIFFNYLPTGGLTYS